MTAIVIAVVVVVATLVGLGIGWILGHWSEQRAAAEAYEFESVVEQELAEETEYLLAESERTVDELRAELENESERVAGLESQLVAVQEASSDSVDGDEARGLREQLAASAAIRNELERRVEGLESELASRQQEIRELREQVREPVAPADSGLAMGDVPAHIAEIAARTAGGEAVVEDDLKMVHGIGPKLESTLKGLGIASFRQIANLEDDDIAHITEILGVFKGRIERDDWVSNAAKQHAKKYSEPA